MTTRAEIANAFRIAREGIASHEDTYICNALPGTDAGEQAKSIIHERMGPVPADVGCRSGYAVWHWLDAQGVDMDAFDDHAMRQYRLRWLDALIEEFSK